MTAPAPQPEPLRCITVSYGRVRGTARNYRYYEPVIYRAKLLKNGLLVWVVDRACGHARRSPRLALQDAEVLAERYSLPYIEGVRQFREVRLIDLPQ